MSVESPIKTGKSFLFFVVTYAYLILNMGTETTYLYTDKRTLPHSFLDSLLKTFYRPTFELRCTATAMRMQTIINR
jgi:hypothetical protein